MPFGLFILIFGLGLSLTQAQEAPRGFGYLGAFDADAEASFSFRCDADSQLQRLLSSSCGGETAEPLASRRELETLLHLVEREALTQSLRQMAFQQLRAQVRALAGEGSPSVPTPSCLRGEAAGDLPTDRAAEVAANLSEGAILRAFVEWSNVVAAQAACGTDANLCADTITARRRIEDANPILFDPAFGSSGRGEVRRRALRNLLVSREIGLREAWTSMEASREVAATGMFLNRLQNRVVEGLAESGGIAGRGVTGLRESLRMLRAEYAAYLRAADRGEAICRLDLAQALSFYPGLLRQVLVDLPADELSTARFHLCRYPELALARPVPQCGGVTEVVREDGGRTVTVNRRASHYPFSSPVNYVIDVPPPGAAEGPTIRTDVRFGFVEGVSAPDRAAFLARHQQTNEFYNCMSGYRSGRLAYAGRTYRCPPDSGVQRPPVRFALSFTEAPGEGAVTVSRCYRAESASMDCGVAREVFLQTCADNSRRRRLQARMGRRLSPGISLHPAEVLTALLQGSFTPPAGMPAAEPVSIFTGASTDATRLVEPGSLTDEQILTDCQVRGRRLSDSDVSRPVTDHWILDTPVETGAHEVGHLLGLSDEYAEVLRGDLRTVGATDSYMGPGEDSGGGLLPRHIEEMLAPLDCVSSRPR